MRKYSVQLSWSDDDGVWVATSPEFDGVTAFGESRDEALGELKVALDLAEETYRDEGWALPLAEKVSDYSGQLRIRMAKNLHAQLVRQAKLNGVSLNLLIVSYLAERAGFGAAEHSVAQRLSSMLDGFRNAIAMLEEGHDYGLYADLFATTAHGSTTVVGGLQWPNSVGWRLYGESPTEELEPWRTKLIGEQ